MDPYNGSMALHKQTNKQTQIKDVHKTKAEYKCDICNKEFNRKCNLNGHINTVHERKQETKCECMRRQT